jgi:hypothetical protein
MRVDADAMNDEIARHCREIERCNQRGGRSTPF